MIYRSRSWLHRRELSPEETAANAAKRAKRAAAAMTCQCCGRAILANKGSIALHGYERPGYGWQTASCMGAKYLPFEVSRERLGDLIRALQDMVKTREQRLIDVTAETVSVPFTYSERLGLGFTKRVNKTVQVTRATFDKIKAELGGKFAQNCVYRFDDLMRREQSHVESELRHLRSDLAMHEKRFAEWKQTHHRVENRWEKIDA